MSGMSSDKGNDEPYPEISRPVGNCQSQLRGGNLQGQVTTRQPNALAQQRKQLAGGATKIHQHVT